MIAPDWYDAEYYEGATKSEYQPYGPGDWADWLSQMVVEHLSPTAVLDVGCAYGYLVERLVRSGVDAQGFDHSPFAVDRAVIPDRIWRGDVADPQSWRDTDLVVCTEVLEHLTDEQAKSFFSLAAQHGSRALVLVTTADSEHSDSDESHINLKSIGEWGVMAGQSWELGNADAINQDWRSQEMQWAGRFILLSHEGGLDHGEA